mmetsp:Transcript_642/g.1529  ORF Transcript_642/g.1529 Transcript_642/m.1529 type:complete len:934 (+) Transcript_642:31-2832(+)
MLDSNEESPSPFDIWDILFSKVSKQWLLGALLAVLASALECLGLILQKKAQYKMMGDNLRPEDPIPPRLKVAQKPVFWVGVCLYLLHSPVNTMALKYAPDTTVIPLNTVFVLLNFLFSFGILYERFRRRDICATFVCILGAVGMSLALTQSVPGHLEDLSVEQVIEAANDIFGNVGFAAYIMVWLLLFTVGLYTATFVSAAKVAKVFAAPLLVGLLFSLFHFLSKIAVTLLSRSSEEVWESPLTRKALTWTALLYLIVAFAASEGVRHLPCRFFMPAMFVTIQVLTVTQDLLFFRLWDFMTAQDLVYFVGCSFVCIWSLSYISAERRVIPSPINVALNSPLLPPAENAIRGHQSVVAIMDEYKIRVPEQGNVPLSVFNMNVNFTGKWKMFPIVSCLALILIPVALWASSYPFHAFLFLTVFSVYQGWKMGAFIALFAYLGVKKIEHYANADFEALHEAEMKKQQPVVADAWPSFFGENENNKDGGVKRPVWKEVVHFVVVPNYKEDLEVLRVAIDSVASSALASTQICLVLAMEEREAGAREKAALLSKEYAGKFKDICPTYHPAGLPNEVPGKSANTRWAAEKIWNEFVPAQRLDLANVILTVGDADSQFHSEWFAALTYHFVNAGGSPGKTPYRYLTIWQPPILHLKNYLTQPAVVRLASFITSQHELANLADPNAPRVPYSTYSISALLAQQVGGWDPEWISEDWHMALKCFLATGGRLKVTPIFLPILNYTPEGDSFFKTLMARWLQAKRHALGFSELVYFNEHFPRILMSIPEPRARIVFAWRALFLWVKLLMIHIFMAVFPVIAPMNGILIAFFNHHKVTQALNINSWTFLINCVSQAIGLISFVCIFLVSVVLYEAVKPRIDGATDNNVSVFWRSQTMHFITVVPQSLIYLPFFFICAGCAEWIAAVKTAFTTKFEYITAAEGARG